MASDARVSSGCDRAHMYNTVRRLLPAVLLTATACGSPEASEGGFDESLVATTDPLDPASCLGEQVSLRDVAAKVGVTSHGQVGKYAVKMVTRRRFVSSSGETTVEANDVVNDQRLADAMPAGEARIDLAPVLLHDAADYFVMEGARQCTRAFQTPDDPYEGMISGVPGAAHDASSPVRLMSPFAISLEGPQRACTRLAPETDELRVTKTCVRVAYPVLVARDVAGGTEYFEGRAASLTILR